MEWSYIPFEESIEKVTYTTKIPKKKFLSSGNYPIISQEAEFINGYWDNKDDVFDITDPVVIFGDHTKVVKHIDFNFVLGADGVKVLKPINELNSRFFAYFLESAPVADLGYARHYRLLKEISVPLPPISEQKRIVTILDQVFDDIEQARAKTEENLKNARELFESYLQQVFSNQIDNCMVRSMSDKTLLTMIDGDRGKNYPKKSEFLSEGHCLFLSTKNVRSDGFLFEQKMFIDEKLDSLLRKGKLERNDVVLTTRGTIGNLALYDDTVDYENIRINSGMLILRPNVAEILPSYLFEIMRSEIIRSQIEAKVSGAAQPQLPVNTLNTFTFPVPQSLGDQLKAVELIREAEVTIKKLIRIYNDKLASLDKLKKSILQKAFSGELTKTLESDASKGAAA